MTIINPGVIILRLYLCIDYQPQHSPFCHQLRPGMAHVGWKPSICTPEQAAGPLWRWFGN